MIEEKAAKIKDWVTSKLKEVRSHNLQHVRQGMECEGVLPPRSHSSLGKCSRSVKCCFYLWCRWNKRTSS